jgi:mercuric ion transport protein
MMWSGTTKATLSTAGGLAAAIGSTLCCVGPLVAVLVGVSGAGIARTFEPWRPAFVVLTVGAFAYGHWNVRRLKTAVCEPGSPCASPRTVRWINALLWVGTVIAAPVLLVPWWSRYVLG